MTPVLPPCSRSAHDQNVLARRPQWDQHGSHSKREKAIEGRLDDLLLLAERAPSEGWRGSGQVPFLLAELGGDRA